jgi:hypothetical protein
MSEKNRYSPNRRDFMKGASATAIGTALAMGARPVYGANDEGKERVGSWCKDTYRQLHLDSHFGALKDIFADFDAEAAADMFVRAEVQMVSYFSKCWAGYSYYPTKFGIHHPSLERDFTGEFTAALKKRGIRCIIYYMMATERKLQKEHPDWLINGDPKLAIPDTIKDEGVAIMCYNSPYTDRVSIPQMKEIIELYDVDGFFVDIVMQQYLQWNCYCKNCRELYAKEIGGEIPTIESDPNAFKYRKWSNAHMEAHMEKVYRALAELNPDIAIINNYAWMATYPVTPPWYVPHVTWDTPTPQVGNFAWNFSLEARYLYTLPDVPFSCMNTRGNNWMDWALREPEAFMQECGILIAAGGANYLSDIPYPSGNPDPPVYDIFGAVNRRYKALEPIIKRSRPVKEVAVLHSADSIWTKSPLKPKTTWTFTPAYYSVTGAHKALIEEHVQMGILNSEVFVDTLEEYRAVILSDQRILNDRETAAVKQFVRNGGALIATHATGIRDTDNNKLRDFALGDVLGIRYLSSPDVSNCYLRVTPELSSFNVPAMDVEAGGGYTRIETTTARKILDLVPPYQGEKSGPPDVKTDCPGITINTYGKGKALYCASDILGGYFEKATPNMRKIAAWALNLVYPETSRLIVCENTPINVEMFYNRSENERFIHLINYSGDKRDTGTPQAQDFITVHDIGIRTKLPKRPKSVTLIPAGKKVAFDYSNGWLRFDALPLEIHDIYRIDMS